VSAAKQDLVVAFGMIMKDLNPMFSVGVVAATGAATSGDGHARRSARAAGTVIVLAAQRGDRH